MKKRETATGNSAVLASKAIFCFWVLCLWNYKKFLWLNSVRMRLWFICLCFAMPWQPLCVGNCALATCFSQSTSSWFVCVVNERVSECVCCQTHILANTFRPAAAASLNLRNQKKKRIAWMTFLFKKRYYPIEISVWVFVLLYLLSY